MIKCGYRTIREHVTTHLVVSGYSWKGISCSQECGGWRPWNQKISQVLINYARLFQIYTVIPSVPSDLSAYMPHSGEVFLDHTLSLSLSSF